MGHAESEPGRALQPDVGVEQAIGRNARIQVTVYDRERMTSYGVPVPRPGWWTAACPDRDPRVRESRRWLGTWHRDDASAPRRERVLQVGFSFGRNRYHDAASQESYWGDLDQRHTMNLYGLYRISPRTSVSAKLRMGSNFPAPGYYTESAGKYYVADTKNEVRLPSFARLDMRLNRTFTWSTRRLTLFAEVINVLNRENVRYHPPSIDVRTLEARRLFESLLPVVPSAGLLFEF